MRRLFALIVAVATLFSTHSEVHAQLRQGDLGTESHKLDFHRTRIQDQLEGHIHTEILLPRPDGAILSYRFNNLRLKNFHLNTIEGSVQHRFAANFDYRMGDSRTIFDWTSSGSFDFSFVLEMHSVKSFTPAQEVLTELQLFHSEEFENYEMPGGIEEHQFAEALEIDVFREIFLEEFPERILINKQLPPINYNISFKDCPLNLEILKDNLGGNDGSIRQNGFLNGSRSTGTVNSNEDIHMIVGDPGECLFEIQRTDRPDTPYSFRLRNYNPQVDGKFLPPQLTEAIIQLWPADTRIVLSQSQR